MKTLINILNESNKKWYEKLLDETTIIQKKIKGRERYFIPNVNVVVIDDIFYHLENILTDMRDGQTDFEDIDDSEEFLEEITEYITESVAQNTNEDWDYVKEIFHKITDEVWVEILKHKFIDVK